MISLFRVYGFRVQRFRVQGLDNPSVTNRFPQTPFVDYEDEDDDENQKPSSTLRIHRWTMPILLIKNFCNVSDNPER
jgi:hypothetical protein